MVDTSVNFEVFDLDAEINDPLTQPELIKKYFKLKTGVSRMFGLGLKNVLAVVDCILKQMETENIVNFSHAKLEREFTSMRDADRAMSGKALTDANLYEEIKHAIAAYKDEDKDVIILEHFEKHLKEARKSFNQQYQNMKQAEQVYLKKAFEAEKAEIKKQIATKSDEIQKYTERFEALKNKVERKLEDYQNQLIILRESGRIYREESNKYADARLRVDHKRAVHTLEKLDYYAAKTQFKPEDAEDVDFSGMRVNEILVNRRPMENITIQGMKRYKGTKNKEALYEQMRTEMEEERRKQGRRQDVMAGSSSVENPVDPGPSHVVYQVGSKYLVTTAYIKQASNQMSLTPGKIVKLLMPPNANGFAVGQKKNTFGRKRKGYFPVSHVTPVN